ncbi:MAG TPA: histidine kinase N-terminal 7TM domain-containing protein [Candidatus Cryosericum sp.]|nr:histidine kinase N-terminal 7TM domain-containing protein [Candidatus Cryosericum sp.]
MNVLLRLTPYTWPLLLAALVSAIVAALASTRRRSRGALAFSALMAVVVVDVLVSLFMLSSRTLAEFLFWIKVSFVSGGLGVAWLVFTLRYDGKSLRTVARVGSALAVEPVTMAVLAWFNDWHHLLWTGATAEPVAATGLLHVVAHFGPLFWVWTGYQYALLLAGAIILLHGLPRAPMAYRGQTLAVLAALVVPWTANMLFVAGRTPVSGIDLTPLAFAVSGIILFIAVYRFRFLDLVPISRSTVLEAMPSGVIVLDSAGRVVDINPAAEQVLGCKAQGVLGTPAARVMPQLSAALARGEAEATLLVDGIERSFELRVSPLRGSMGQLILLTDVTERKRMAASLLQSQKLDGLGLMAGGIAHDFNNILTAILGNLGLVRDQEARSESIDEPLSNAEQATRRAAGLTRNLLTFSRNVSPTPVPVNVNTAADLVLQSIAELLPPGITLRRVYAPDVWSVLIDQVQLEQTVMNLVVNARDAMEGHGTLTVSSANASLDEQFARTHPGSRAGEFVLLQVTDTGAGMSERVRSHLFEPFFTTKPLGQGTGLGLAVAYGAVQQAGGWILVDTVEGRGTTFSVYLPRCSEQPEPAAQDKRLVRRPEPGQKSVMVVDDEELVRQMTRRMLERDGYAVITAADGPSALRQFEENGDTVDLVLLDMSMPGMTGDQVLSRLREMDPRVPVVISSGYSFAASVEDLVGTPGGANAFLSKPYTLQELSQTVASTLSSADRQL